MCYKFRKEEDYLSTIQYTHFQAQSNKNLGLTGNHGDQLIIDEYQDELMLPAILDLKSFLTLLFKYVKRELAFEIIQDGLTKNQINIISTN